MPILNSKSTFSSDGTFPKIKYGDVSRSHGAVEIESNGRERQHVLRLFFRAGWSFLGGAQRRAADRCFIREVALFATPSRKIIATGNESHLTYCL